MTRRSCYGRQVLAPIKGKLIANLFPQEIKPTMIESLKAKQTLKAAELQDGDIVCFQRMADRKPSDRHLFDKRLGSDNKAQEEV